MPDCKACTIHDCPWHCQGCGHPVAHNPESCSNDLYTMVREGRDE